MHIPDGYLSPVFSIGTGIATVPMWGVAVNKVQKVLNQRTVPLLAIFAAFSFTIMMFNIPVPGGTTAHAVGGTLIAIVLGPWAAVIGISTALIIQALFFGDGGVLAIFANCLNMGIILPFTGYYAYRLIAGKTPLLSTRRIWAAGIGAYLGITAAALAVGIELGLQPLLFQSGGHALYSPYTMEVAIPAMLLSHAFGASLVEALVTALGMAYIQKNHPQYLTALRGAITNATVPEGRRLAMPLWQMITIGLMGSLVLLFIAGLITGGGNVAHLFGADWSQVAWSDVGMMLLIVLAIAAIAIPLAWFLLPASMRQVGTTFVAIAIFAPIGLIAPGFAYGEGSADDVKQAFGYMPQGLKQLSGVWSAPFSGYNLQAPFFSDPNAPMWRQGLGYELSGLIGILLIGAIFWGLAALLARFSKYTKPQQEASEQV
ncbi:hypothetical protein KDA_57480 [Dictyobacter alpinus]|uniref:Cobalamin biosynthesis protein CbiM n=1 Tax=Dictyobacter alpinus TaxID=2014873 RepID=A0A402BFW6_9CHLR|nr:cobalt transporter CbiM [Dictyobacter alpinus]GCE30264.1 hypothetical protein KDA_57480 [Dictyobacter alpinus]